ncbi:cadherin-related family member 5 isoform X2 [Eleginops maclovinus]|uniref:cadherin-related family member 5 isoform X2 n=1 Tax=Eleginops maclovinus TaxID=56733 RepID=UPI00308088DE
MDGNQPHFVLRTSSCFILLIFLHTSTAQICSAPSTASIAENNKVGDLVTTITLDPGVTVDLTPVENPNHSFRIVGNRLEAAKVLDYEDISVHVVGITCTKPDTGAKLELPIVVTVENLNDNPPVFEQSQYLVTLKEMSPSGTTVGRYDATDLDGGSLYYTLMPLSSGFALKSSTNPDLLVVTPVDFDKVKSVKLILSVQDTPLKPANSRASSTTTITVSIEDVDNRPPWFQPCTRHEVGGMAVCQSNGYNGKVVLNEQEAGALALTPGPLYAIDGDLGLNEEIVYSLLEGDSGGLFQINPSTGNISMLKPADVLGTIRLTVLARQMTNAYQSSSTSVTISVHVKSLHPPQFQRPEYRGVVSAVGMMAMDPDNKDQPLRIIATDDDYAATGGRNPHITYSVKGNSDFSIIDGYLFMTKDLPIATLSLQVVALDSTNDESVTAQLSVEVKTVIVPAGGFSSVAMAALGASLGVLLFICLVVIVVLAVRVRKGKADSRKIYEASLFQSSLGKGGQKEGIQYTNDAFQNDEDGGSTGSGGDGASAVKSSPHYKEILKPSLALPAVLRDDTSEAGSDKTDNEKEVKPILTKERRLDDGYKSVWFKEDIDPDAKVEVVIIPDSREDDSEEEEDEDDSLKKKTQRVMFNDADLDSGLGVKIEDPGEDSEDDEELTVGL